MSETVLTTAPETAGERLGHETGLLAGRLAALLRDTLPDGGGTEGPLARGRAFLEAMAEMAAAAEEGSAAEEATGLDRLVDGLGLSPCEIDLLLLAGLAEEHEGYAEVLRLLNPQGQPSPTTGLAAQLLCPGSGDRERRALRELLENGPAVRSGALRVVGDGPFFSRGLLLAESLWPALAGIDAWPAALRRPEEPVALCGLETWLEEPDARRAAAALEEDLACTVLVTAEDEESAFHRGAALVRAAGREGAGLFLPQAPDADVERLIGLHSLVRGAVPVLRLPAKDGPGLAEVPAFAGQRGPVVVCARAGAVAVRGRRPVIGVSCGRLGPLALRRMWAGTLPSLAGSAPVLAARYPIEPAAAQRVAADLRLLERIEGRSVEPDDVAGSVRARSSFAAGGVKQVRPSASWEHLVLPAARLAQLREAVDRLLHQARVLEEWRFLAGRPGAQGVRMLLAGPPGTGKTLSAEVMARALGVDLLVVDLSRVVSKWIGETEKNLAEVFDSAESARAVLLFDEADALFGKRTEVSDAHDRYANLETAYLLARLERFEGLTILSTNLRQNLDPAFTRRLEFVVDFNEPGRDERLALWKCHLPAAAPLAPDVDLAELSALYPLVGGTIRNAAVAAAFLAAADGGPIARIHFVRAIRREYEKSGKAFPGLPPGMAGP
jgi:hypothetical protein